MRSETTSDIGCSGRLLCEELLCGLVCGAELLTGGADDRVIMRMIGSFCIDSMKSYSDYANSMVRKAAGSAFAAAMRADPRDDIREWTHVLSVEQMLHR